MTTTWKSEPGAVVIQLGQSEIVRLDRVDLFQLRSNVIRIYIRGRTEPVDMTCATAEAAKFLFKDLMVHYEIWLKGSGS